MSELDPKIENIADAFKINTDNRVDISSFSTNEKVIFKVLQDELYKALRLLENAITSK